MRMSSVRSGAIAEATWASTTSNYGRAQGALFIRLSSESLGRQISGAIQIEIERVHQYPPCLVRGAPHLGAIFARLVEALT